jgi:trehalose 6-phosphate phosphatase
MSLPFFEHGALRVSEIVRPGMLCAFDFDGTLAPIVKEPARASIPAAVLRRLRVLTEHVSVAVITGRSVKDVSARLGFEPDYIVGNHGIEGIPEWEGRAASYRLLCEEWQRKLTDALKDQTAFDPGIWIENKIYSLSVHYRIARDRVRSEEVLCRLFAALLPDAHIVAGKCVFNLLPPDSPDKGMALSKLCQARGIQTALFVGDDVTDEDVFKLHRQDWLTVRIERSSDSAAEFYLHHRLDMVQLLDTLIQQVAVDRHDAAAGMAGGAQ